MTKLELEAIRERVEKATEGPWEYNAKIDSITAEDKCGIFIIADDTETVPDAEFIAHAREDIPKLLAEIERLRNVITVVMDETSCDDTWEYLRRVVFGEEQLDLSYRIGGDSE